MNRRMFLIAGLTGLAGGTGQGRGQAAGSDAPPWLSDLQSAKSLTRQAGLEQAIKERKALIERLLQLARSKKKQYDFFDTKALAIELLGEMKAVEAVEEFIKQITFNPPTYVLESGWLEGFPCAKALAAIGVPAVQRILSWVEMNDCDEKTLCLFSWVIRCVDGAAVGEFRIREEIKTLSRFKDPSALDGQKRMKRLLYVYRNRAAIWGEMKSMKA